MLIKGYWHSDGSAAQLEAALYTAGEQYTIKVTDGDTYKGLINELKVSDRLGQIQRTIRLPDNAIFATHDNDSIDQLFEGYNKKNRFLHKLESSLKAVLVGIVLIVITSYSFIRWGIPWAGETIAHALPHKTNELIAANTMDFLDKYFFDESQLDEKRREQIEAHFIAKLLPMDENSNEINYKLHFRYWGDGEYSIPNALALPSGDIVLTDRFVELSQNQDEIDSVILHEMGHVVHRHSLEMLVEATLFSTAIMLATGDASGIADMGIGLGSILVSSHYSRNHETEADLYAFEKMLKAGIDPSAFASILSRMVADMEAYHNKADDQAENSQDDKDDPLHHTENKHEKENQNLLDYLSSHPSTDERIKQAERFSECFKQGLTECPQEDGKLNKE